METQRNLDQLSVMKLVALRLYALGDKETPKAETKNDKVRNSEREQGSVEIKSDDPTKIALADSNDLKNQNISEHSKKSKNDSYRKAVLAKFRHVAGREFENSPEIWDFILVGDEPPSVRVQEVSFLVFTLYAIHTQGGKKAHQDNLGFARALNRAKFGDDDTQSQGIVRRFNQLILAHNLKEIKQHSRGLIQILKQKELSFDYVRFAGDLSDLLYEGRSRKRILRKWGKEFWVNETKKKEGETQKSNRPKNSENLTEKISK
jgi:CRISPR system Cascade subunit CasB